MVSDLWKIWLIVHKSTFFKSAKREEEKEEEKKRQQSLADSVDNTVTPTWFLRPHFQNSFP